MALSSSPPRVDELRPLRQSSSEASESRRVVRKMYLIYLLVNEANNETYVGFTENIDRRLDFHKNRKVKSTKKFGNFRHLILENNIDGEHEARVREKYWKSCAGRKKIKKEFLNLALSSSG